MHSHNTSPLRESLQRAMLAGGGAGAGLALLYLGGDIVYLPLLTIACVAVYLHLTRDSYNHCSCK